MPIYSFLLVRWLPNGNLRNYLMSKKSIKIALAGNPNSGKTTVLNHFKPDEQKHLDIVPTVGFNVEKFKSRFHFDL